LDLSEFPPRFGYVPIHHIYSQIRTLEVNSTSTNISRDRRVVALLSGGSGQQRREPGTEELVYPLPFPILVRTRIQRRKIRGRRRRRRWERRRIRQVGSVGQRRGAVR
jgi:hypothetical protein